MKENALSRLLTLITVGLLLLVAIVACGDKQPSADEIRQVRLFNLSDERLSNVKVKFPDILVTYGEMPPLSTSAYFTVTNAQPGAPMGFATDVDPEVIVPASFVFDEADALPAGRYAYAIHYNQGEFRQALVVENELHVDADLIDHWLWLEMKQADGSSFVPESNGDDVPGILFTLSTSENKLLGGHLYGTFSGCNGGGGAFFTNEQRQLVTQLVTFGGEQCFEALMTAEAQMMDVINGISTYEIKDDQLHIYAPSGDELIFGRKPDQ